MEYSAVINECKHLTPYRNQSTSNNLPPVYFIPVPDVKRLSKLSPFHDAHRVLRWLLRVIPATANRPKYIDKYVDNDNFTTGAGRNQAPQNESSDSNTVNADNAAGNADDPDVKNILSQKFQFIYLVNNAQAAIADVVKKREMLKAEKEELSRLRDFTRKASVNIMIQETISTERELLANINAMTDKMTECDKLIEQMRESKKTIWRDGALPENSISQQEPAMDVLKFEHLDLGKMHCCINNYGEPIFVASDILRVLKYTYIYRPGAIMFHVPDIWKGVFRLRIEDEDGYVTQERNVFCLTEQGLYYFLNFSSRHKAQAVREWVKYHVVSELRITEEKKRESIYRLQSLPAEVAKVHAVPEEKIIKLKSPGDQIRVYEHPKFGTLRVVLKGKDVWFVAQDVQRAMHIHYSQAVSKGEWPR
jgi:prophage antirepressor-like protein